MGTYTDVPECLEKINDTLLTQLARANRSDEFPNGDTRRALWKHVFSDGWTTTSPNIMPAPKPAIAADKGYPVHIGTFITDLPPIAGSVPYLPAAAFGQIPHGFWGLPAHRRAFLRVANIHLSSFGLLFEIVDANGDLAAAPDNNITPNPWIPNMRAACAQAMFRQDSAVTYTVTVHNLAWIVYFARNRLVRALKLLGMFDKEEWRMIKWRTGTGGDISRLAGRVNYGEEALVVMAQEEDYGLGMVTLGICADVVQELTEVEVVERRYGEGMRRVLSVGGL